MTLRNLFLDALGEDKLLREKKPFVKLHSRPHGNLLLRSGGLSRRRVCSTRVVSLWATAGDSQDLGCRWLRRRELEVGLPTAVPQALILILILTDPCRPAL